MIKWTDLYNVMESDIQMAHSRICVDMSKHKGIHYNWPMYLLLTPNFHIFLRYSPSQGGKDSLYKDTEMGTNMMFLLRVRSERCEMKEKGSGRLSW